jgi:hypothetical protein
MKRGPSSTIVTIPIQNNLPKNYGEIYCMSANQDVHGRHEGGQGSEPTARAQVSARWRDRAADAVEEARGQAARGRAAAQG